MSAPGIQNNSQLLRLPVYYSTHFPQLLGGQFLDSSSSSNPVKHGPLTTIPFRNLMLFVRHFWLLNDIAGTLLTTGMSWTPASLSGISQHRHKIRGKKSYATIHTFLDINHGFRSSVDSEWMSQIEVNNENICTADDCWPTLPTRSRRWRQWWWCCASAESSTSWVVPSLSEQCNYCVTRPFR